MYSRCLLLCTVLLLLFYPVKAQEVKMDFEKYDPVSTLVVPGHSVTRARYPFIDVHNHQSQLGSRNIDQLISEMNRLNMKVMVNLSGGTGARLNTMAADLRNRQAADRIILFANIDFSGIGKEGWTAAAVKQLEEDVRNGANGLKIYKNLGFSVRDTEGKRVTIDDRRLDAVWEKCAALKIPVLIHTADPEPFWQNADEHNERWLELQTHPNRKRSDTNPAPWEELIAEQHRMFRNNPRTTFIAAHFGWYPNNLQKLDSLLTALPNVMVEFGAVIAELGRQPRTSKAFFTKYQDRILFGKDSWVPEEYATYFRVLETEDEYFPYHKKYHAFWRMYGMGLSDDILKKIYYRNALRIIPRIDQAMFPD